MDNQALRNAIDKIKADNDLVEYISHDIELKKSGSWHVGFCPFHQNVNTPSFMVKGDYWECKGACAEHGDIIKYVMKREGCSFSEAIETLRNGKPLSVKLVQIKPMPQNKPKRSFTPILSNKALNLALWQAYNQAITPKLIAAYGLTHGALPGSICKHTRLITPMTIGGVVVGLRGRVIDGVWPGLTPCQHVQSKDNPHGCAKWTQSARGQAIIYNGAILLNRFKVNVHEVQNRLLLGDTAFNQVVRGVVVVENSLDCLLLQQSISDNIGVVALQGINPSQIVIDNLAKACRLAEIERVTIAFDRSRDKNSTETAKAINRLRLALDEYGVNVAIYEWPHGGYKDFGEYFKQTSQCDHKLHWHYIGGDIYCMVCHAHLWQWARDDQIAVLAENSPYKALG